MLCSVNPDSIPRYAEPTWGELREWEPQDGRCYNCDHRVRVDLDGKSYDLCVCERDDHKGEQFGDVHECDPEVDDCTDWEWDGHTDWSWEYHVELGL